MRTFGERAVSTVLSASLLIFITSVFAILLHGFVMGNFENLAETPSTQPFRLSIQNIAINSTCIAVYIGNSWNRDFVIDKVYVNRNPQEIPSFPSKTIPKNSTTEVYIPGSYAAGTLYEVKIVFEVGYTVLSMQRG